MTNLFTCDVLARGEPESGCQCQRPHEPARALQRYPGIPRL